MVPVESREGFSASGIYVAGSSGCSLQFPPVFGRLGRKVPGKVAGGCVQETGTGSREGRVVIARLLEIGEEGDTRQAFFPRRRSLIPDAELLLLSPTLRSLPIRWRKKNLCRSGPFGSAAHHPSSVVVEGWRFCETA
ncbi:hypothetical protein E2C01_070895 [Portunus trituberculatus]|uniref:Uncharacterized protein n=1 Tax=Portunus trituberculatus TaxID=210409 RepID=A0A5B7HTY0_PORTR|nr:hypothetical protein [Portunus trituberculatus]